MFGLDDLLAITKRLTASGYRKIVDNSCVMVFHRDQNDRVYLYSDRTRVSTTSNYTAGFRIVSSVLGCPYMRLNVGNESTVNFWC